MKVVIMDNFENDLVPVRLYMDNLTFPEAQKIAKRENNKTEPILIDGVWYQDYYAVVEDSYDVNKYNYGITIVDNEDEE